MNYYFSKILDIKLNFINVIIYINKYDYENLNKKYIFDLIKNNFDIIINIY